MVQRGRQNFVVHGKNLSFMLSMVQATMGKKKKTLEGLVQGHQLI